MRNELRSKRLQTESEVDKKIYTEQYIIKRSLNFKQIYEDGQQKVSQREDYYKRKGTLNLYKKVGRNIFKKFQIKVHIKGEKKQLETNSDRSRRNHTEGE